MCAALITQITLDQFFKVRSLRAEPTQHLEAKAKSMKETYICFNTLPGNHGSGSSHNFHGSSNSQHHHNNARNHKGRYWKDDKDRRQHEVMRTDIIKIGTRELSRESLARKDFLALMNKLSMQNKEHIFKTIRNVFREDCIHVYVQILWDMMQRSSDFIPLYISAQDVLSSASKSSSLWKSQWANIWEQFIEMQSWTPSKEIIEQDHEDYNEFCDFVKWKKRTLGALKALIALSSKGWIEHNIGAYLLPILMTNCEEQLNQSNGNKVTDSYIEEMITLLANGDGAWKELVHPWVTHMLDTKQHTLRHATRFKMFDLNDLCTIN